MSQPAYQDFLPPHSLIGPDLMRAIRACRENRSAHPLKGIPLPGYYRPQFISDNLRGPARDCEPLQQPVAVAEPEPSPAVPIAEPVPPVPVPVEAKPPQPAKGAPAPKPPKVAVRPPTKSEITRYKDCPDCTWYGPLSDYRHHRWANH